jgi:hypothetical protein
MAKSDARDTLVALGDAVKQVLAQPRLRVDPALAAKAALLLAEIRTKLPATAPGDERETLRLLVRETVLRADRLHESGAALCLNQALIELGEAGIAPPRRPG